MRGWRHQAGDWFLGVCGWLLVYVSIGISTATFLIFLDGNNTGCWPHLTVFAVPETNCKAAFGNILWTVWVGIPWLLITPLYLAATLVRASVINGFDRHYLNESILWMGYSIPAVVVLVAGVFYWQRRSRWLGLVALMPTVYLVVRFGLSA